MFIRGIGEVNVPSTRNDYIVNFEKLQEKIYIRAKSWGIAGNHEEIILATFPIENENREYFKDKGYVFFPPLVQAYKENRDWRKDILVPFSFNSIHTQSQNYF